ncbi:hypothetical protein BU24DRAFT_477075 [Aaosphaeria arxii CBS 175.79]|uniref:VOC domain-containing protein n=1 Tax=Aaosphaeria arxii CBS 175.79 TaxID=1450172 RepID=A0A6A5Y372_9PLEO|nr:uncharacterized protein BU24DRAFT_477075 [Aaosphaeria arxii CBS 175.79]KAF2019985.1 hypothetical protein BU24DRAFT_477075 [Aaosphaeria arxii CBS 175.79]
MYRYTNIASPFKERPAQGGINWIEIPANDVSALKEFYKSLFPSWKFGNPAHVPEDFVSFFKIDEPAYVEGAIIKVNSHTLTATNQGETKSIGMVPYFLVDSIAEMHDKIIGLGGKMCLDKTDARGDGCIIVLITIVQ